MDYMELLDASFREWGNIKKIIVYGFGNVGKKAIKKLQNDFDIIAIIDNDKSKWGTHFGIPIISLKEARSIIGCEKIIVMTGGKEYKNITNELENIGLKEYKDFCSIEEFLGMWYWLQKKENCLLEVHIAITMKCTLKCENCNMFVTHYDTQPQLDCTSTKYDIDTLFSHINYVCCLTLLGGEPLLNEDIGNIIEYIWEKYKDRVGTINIITNGTIIPKEELIGTLKKCNVLVYISDYTHTIAYEKKLNQLVEVLEENQIETVRRKSDVWKDFGFPTKELTIKGDLINHMKCCSPLFHGLNDGKFYYCHVLWSAERCGLYKAEESDFVDLGCGCKNAGNLGRDIVMHALGQMENQYVSLCRYCGGCGDDNPNEIMPAIQKK